jgi:hypothetical protein
MAHTPTIDNYSEQINWLQIKRPLVPSLALTKLIKFVGAWTGIIGLTLVLIALSPLIALLVFGISKAFSRMKKDSEKLKIRFEETYMSMEFNQLKKEEEELDGILSNLRLLNKEKLPESKLFISLKRNTESIIKNFEDIQNLLVSRYTFNKDEMFESDEEFAAYQEALKSLGDFWDYESTPEEKEYVFNQKNK